MTDDAKEGGSPSKRTATRKTVPVQQLESQRRRLDLSVAAFSKALGYSDNAFGEWLKSGSAPEVASLAAEALVRRQSSGGHLDILIFTRIVKGVPRSISLDGLKEMTLDGITYVLVPRSLA